MQKQAYAPQYRYCLATNPGAVLAYVTLGSMHGIVGPILALSAASFIYIGLADVVPGLHRRIGPEPGFAQWLSSWPVSGRSGTFS